MSGDLPCMYNIMDMVSNYGIAESRFDCCIEVS